MILLSIAIIFKKFYTQSGGAIGKNDRYSKTKQKKCSLLDLNPSLYGIETLYAYRSSTSFICKHLPVSHS